IYVHRIGRTGRVGRSGRAITFITPKQTRDLQAIERHAKTDIGPWSAGAGAATDKPKRERKPREREERETRRPRHTKPRKRSDGARTKLIVKAGLKQGLEPADVIGAIVDHSHLEGEEISNVRLLDRFSFVEVPASR